MKRFFFFILSIMLLGCNSTPSPGPISSVNDETQVILQSAVDNYEVIQEFDIDNCDGKADATRTEHRSFSVEVTSSTELAAKIGASAQIISADVQAAVGTALSIDGERGTSIEVKAPPNSHMFFQLAWVGKSHIGVVQNISGSNIPGAFQSFTPDNVRIKSQYDIGCPITPSPSDQSIEPSQIQEQTTTQPNTSQVTDNLNCKFIDELVTQGDIVQWIDTPLGSGEWSGVQIRPINSILVPAGWVVHHGSPQDQYGPLDLPAGAVASIYSPYSCRPLKKVP